MKSKTLGIAAGAFLVAVLFVVMHLPRTHPLPEGYTDTDFPRGGHRYWIAPGGVKKVGQEVLSYQVVGTVVTGTDRLRLEHDDVRTFLKTHTVSLGDRVQQAAR